MQQANAVKNTSQKQHYHYPTIQELFNQLSADKYKASMSTTHESRNYFLGKCYQTDRQITRMLDRYQIRLSQNRYSLKKIKLAPLKPAEPISSQPNGGGNKKKAKKSKTRY